MSLAVEFDVADEDTDCLYIAAHVGRLGPTRGRIGTTEHLLARYSPGTGDRKAGRDDVDDSGYSRL